MRASEQYRNASRRDATQLRRVAEPLFFEERPVGEVLTRARRLLAVQAPALTPDIGFLVRHGVAETLLKAAVQLAAARKTAARDELFAIGFDRQRYWSMLADELGVPFAADLAGADLVNHAAATTSEALRLSSVLVRRNHVVLLVTAPSGAEIAVLARRLRDTPALVARLRIAAPETIRGFIAAHRRGALGHYAVNRLARTQPALSASHLGPPQGRASATFVATGLAFLILAPAIALTGIAVLLALFFFNCALWRLAACRKRARPMRLEPLPTAALPTYSILVPLYREASVIADLIRHLRALDYPASKLQILMILEADDEESHLAVRRARASRFVEVIAVPPVGPRTKPKALTYALPFARGDYVVVYDAEDRPEADQLRKAAAAFGERPGLGCVQARLAPDNQGSWLARMFTLEYAANFEVLLPALAAWRVPLPLGGTSNHFPRRVLEKVGAWDPFNVTEDADLGVRLARFGYETVTILSRTWEEAPVRFRQWLPQRRRWIKGWIQTALVCRPGRVASGLRLSLTDSLAVHGTVTAGAVGLLLYPLSLAVVAFTAVSLAREGLPPGAWTWFFLAFNANFFLVLAAAFISAFRGLRAIGALRLAYLIPTLPVYWGLMSLAAWQALGQFMKDPSRWEKTPHGVARDRRPGPPAALTG